jgi:hypothetical protein
MLGDLFSENPAVWENVVQPDSPHMTILVQYGACAVHAG